MRALYTMIILLAFILNCKAEPKAYLFNIAMGSKTATTNTLGGDAGITGSIGEINVTSSDGSSTGSVWIAYNPKDGSTAVNMATNVVIGSKTFRPRADGTDISGAALTSDPQNLKYLLCNETIKATILNSPTGVTWKVTIRTDD